MFLLFGWYVLKEVMFNELISRCCKVNNRAMIIVLVGIEQTHEIL